MIRKELFKFFYHEGIFKLNQKADASEAVMYILTFLHAAKIDRNSKQIMRDEQIEFENFDMKCTGDCFIHEHFNLGIEY